MSDSESDRDPHSDVGSYVARAASTAMHAQSAHPILHPGGGWYGLAEDRLARVAAEVYQFPGAAHGEPRMYSVSRRHSESSSLAMPSHTPTWASTASSDRPPSLIASHASIASTTSLRTHHTDSFPAGYYQLEEADDGALHAPPTRLRCQYGLLGCAFSLDGQSDEDLVTFEAHCRSHFRDRLPRRAACPFALCEWISMAGTAAAAWEERLQHMRRHNLSSRIVVPAQPDEYLCNSLWRAGALSDGELKELRLTGRLNRTSTYKVTAGRTRSRRRQQR